MLRLNEIRVRKLDGKAVRMRTQLNLVKELVPEYKKLIGKSYGVGAKNVELTYTEKL